MQNQKTVLRNGNKRNGHPGKRNGQAKTNRKQQINTNFQAPNSSVQTSPKKGKLDSITFIYGFGAAIVLVGAMFKFLGWSFANELFIVGLSIEAVVFLISAFERKEEEVEYKWENVFPQLQGSSGNPLNGSGQGYAQAMDQFQQTLQGMTHEIGALANSMQEIRESMEASADSSIHMHDQMSDYIDLMNRYNDNLRVINDKYDQALDTP